MNKNYTLKDLFNLIKSHLLYLIIAVIVGGACAFMYSKYRIPLMYSSHITMYVQSYYGYYGTDKNYGQNDINSSKQLVNTYIEVIKDDAVMEALGERLFNHFDENVLKGSFSVYDGKISPSSLRSCISVSTVTDTSALKVVTMAKNPEVAAAICNELTAIVRRQVLRRGRGFHFFAEFRARRGVGVAYPVVRREPHREGFVQLAVFYRGMSRGVVGRVAVVVVVVRHNNSFFCFIQLLFHKLSRGKRFLVVIDLISVHTNGEVGNAHRKHITLATDDAVHANVPQGIGNLNAVLFVFRQARNVDVQRILGWIGIGRCLYCFLRNLLHTAWNGIEVLARETDDFL